MSEAVRQRLEAAVIENMDRATQTEMAWGVDDCALWVAEPLRKTLGYDPAAAFRGRYKTERGSRRVLGKGGLLAAMTSAGKRHGWKRIPPARAEPGDVGLALVNDVVSTVICRASGWFVGRTGTGYTAVSTDMKGARGKRIIRLAWRVV